MTEIPAYCCKLVIAESIIFGITLPLLVLSPLSSESRQYQHHLYRSPYHLLHHHRPPRRVSIITLLALSRRQEPQRWPTDTSLTSHSDGTSGLLMEKAVKGREMISVRNSLPPFSFLRSPPSVSLSLFLSLTFCLIVSSSVFVPLCLVIQGRSGHRDSGL